MIQIAICESSSVLLAQVEDALAEIQRILPDTIAYESYSCAADLKKGLEQGEHYQAIYINMELPDADGIAFAGELRVGYAQMDFLLVYFSQQSSFHRLVLGTHPFDILPLPLDRTLLLKNLVAVVDCVTQQADLFLYKKGRSTYQIKKSRIICLESLRRDIVLSVEGQQEEIRYAGALKNELAQFQEIHFLHPHQSYIVNLHYVAEYHTGSLTLVDGKQVPISELRSKEAKEAILRFWEYNKLR